MEFEEIIENIGFKTKKKMDNSFSQNVYLLDRKNVLKIYNNIEIGKNELKFLNYFYNKINVPKVLESGENNEKFYILTEYIQGINYKDEDKFIIPSTIYYKIGELMASLHNLEPLEEDNWKQYMLFRTERSYNIFKQKQIATDFDIDKIYNYIKNEINNLSYKPCNIHCDFRMGNIIINKDNVALIDLESAKTGDSVFDFIKLYRVFSEKNFESFKSGYENKRKLAFDFYKRIHFYNLYDAFTTLGWCIEANRYKSEFYMFNLKFLNKEMNYLCLEEHIQMEKN